MYFAHLDNSTPRICTGITENQVAYPASPNIVEIDSFDVSLIGNTYAAGVFTAPALAPVPRRISVGAFYDRFGAAKWAILADTTPSVVAVIRDASVRAYIDLDNEQLPMGLSILAAAGHTVDAQAILDAPVLESEKP